MRGKLMFLGGLAAGFVLGSRAGRQAYEELVQTAKKVKESPTVQEAAGVVQAQATKVYEQGKDKLSNTRLGDKLMPSESSTTGAAKTDPVAVGTTGTNASTTTPTSGGSSTTGTF
jgi:hypothetical protein